MLLWCDIPTSPPPAEPGSGQGRLEGQRLRLLEVRRGVRTVEEAVTAEDSETLGIMGKWLGKNGHLTEAHGDFLYDFT